MIINKGITRGEIILIVVEKCLIAGVAFARLFR